MILLVLLLLQSETVVSQNDDIQQDLKDMIKTLALEVVKQEMQLLKAEMASKITNVTEKISATEERLNGVEEDVNENRAVLAEVAAMKTKGIKGDSGSPGKPGTKGETGVPGLSVKGEKGIQGRRGIIGKVGPQGETGVPGSAGLPGADGETGVPGSNGIKGETGAIGADGAQGPQGVAGIPGESGADGLAGEVGPQGEAGAPGEDGLKGEPGIPGSKAWKTAIKNTKIELDMQRYSLELKTDSEKGSKDTVYLKLYTEENQRLTTFNPYDDIALTFYYSAYYITDCTGSWTPLSNLPTAINKTWRFTKTATQVTITCNEVEVGKVVFADVDKSKYPQCVSSWSRDVAAIEFDRNDDTDMYREAPRV